MNLNELKEKFKHKASVDLKDIDIALKAVPFLVREVEKLEKQVVESNERISHLSKMLNKRRPPTDKKGQKGNAKWQATVDEEKNRLYVQLAGKFNYHSAKAASNCIIAITPSLRPNFDIIEDISAMTGKPDQRFQFHMRKVTYNLMQMNVGRIIRILNPQIPGLSVLFDPGVSKDKDYNVCQVKTIDEAEEILKNVGQYLKA